MKIVKAKFYLLGLVLLTSIFTSSLTAEVAVFTPDEGLLTQLKKLEFNAVCLPTRGSIRLAPRLTQLCSLPDAVIWSITQERTGNIILGTGNQQRLYRVDPGSGKLRLLFSDDAGEILSVTTLDNKIYFGVTPSGTVYQLLTPLTADSFVNTGETYIHALLPTADRSLLCATGPNGKLLRLYPDRRHRQIFSTASAHITTLCWLEPEKELLLGISPNAVLYQLNLSQSPTKPLARVLYDAPSEEIKAIVTDRNAIYIAVNPGSGDNSGNEVSNQPAVYCLNLNGVPKWQWNCPDSVIFSLVLFNNQLLVLTGNRGLLYLLDTLGQPAVIGRLNEPQLTAGLIHKKRFYLGTANPARLFTMLSDYPDSGFVIGPVTDCGTTAQFGRIELLARTPNGTSIKVDTRSGNSAEPDTLWSQWQEADGKILSPPARFIQWRVRLYSRIPNITPELSRIALYYQPLNRPPQITKLELSTISETDARKGNNQPRRQVTWEASDPDDDSLLYFLYLGSEKFTDWRQLDQRLTEPRYELDTRTIPDGWYTIRLVASDAGDRPKTTALTAEKTTAPFLIDNTPPTVSEIKLSGNQLRITVTDNLSPIIACRMALNAGEWQPLEPSDGVFDETAERFVFNLDTRDVKMVAVWAVDAQGNATSRSLINR